MFRFPVLPLLALLLLPLPTAAQSFTEFPATAIARGTTSAPDGTIWVSSDFHILGFDATGQIANFSIPSDPYGGIVVGPDGALWFPSSKSGPIAVLGRVTRSGEYSEFSLPEGQFGAVVRTSIVLGSDGAFWLGGGWVVHVTRSGLATPFPVAAESIAPASDGGIWYTTYGGNVAGSELRHLSPDGTVTAYPQTRAPLNRDLVSLKLAPDGTLWASLAAVTEAFLVHFDQSLLRTDTLIPGFHPRDGYGAGANDIAPAADGSVWFVTGYYQQGFGRNPGPGVVVPARVGRLSLDGAITQVDRPMFAVPKPMTIGADGSVWFGEGFQMVRLVAEGCRADDHGMCLSGNRFRVQVAWRTSDGQRDLGTALSLTSDTAAFWFFSANNIETVVKVVDGRAANGHFWVFIAALTDVEWEVTVLDTETGTARKYSNPQGTLQSLADTAAF